MLIQRALVTGCAGFIGSHLTESLLADGIEVVGVDCFNDNYARPAKLRNLELARQWDAFDFVPVDLARGELRDLVEGADVIFHLAAEPGVRLSWGARFETYVRNNLLATQHLLEAACAWPEKPFVYASSSSVYGQAEAFPTRETALPRPFSPYGVTKLAAEHLCLSFHDNHGLQATALRYFSVYGPRQRPDMAFTRMSRALIDGDPIVIYGDGQQTRDFTFVGDVVRATRSASTADGVAGRAYNIGGGSQVELLAAVELLGKVAGRRPEINHVPAQEGDVRDTGADAALARRDLGFTPSTDLATGLLEQVSWASADHARSALARSERGNH